MPAIKGNSDAIEVLQSRFTEVVIANDRDAWEDCISKCSYPIEALLIGVKENIDSEVLSRLPDLKVIANAGIGLDHIDVAAAKLKGVKVYSSIGANSKSVGEHALMIMLSSLRNLFNCNNACLNGQDRGGIDRLPLDLSKKNIGVVGAGSTARELIKLLSPFDCKISIWTFSPEKHIDLISTGNCAFVDHISDLFSECNVISIHLPLTEDSKHMIGRDLILKLKQNSVLINTSRFSIVDYDSFCDVTTLRPDLRFGIDSFSLAKSDFVSKNHNLCYLSPHVAGVSIEALRCLELTAANNIICNF